MKCPVKYERNFRNPVQVNKISPINCRQSQLFKLTRNLVNPNTEIRFSFSYFIGRFGQSKRELLYEIPATTTSSLIKHPDLSLRTPVAIERVNLLLRYSGVDTTVVLCKLSVLSNFILRIASRWRVIELEGNGGSLLSP